MVLKEFLYGVGKGWTLVGSLKLLPTVRFSVSYIFYENSSENPQMFKHFLFIGWRGQVNILS